MESLKKNIFSLLSISILGYFFSTNQHHKFESNFPLLLIVIFILLNIVNFISNLNKIRFIFFIFFFYLFLFFFEINFDKIFYKYCNTVFCKKKFIDDNEDKINLNLVPKNFIDNNKIIPLSGLENSFIVGSNENGFFPRLKNDKLGFVNDNSLYLNPIDLLIIGDSYSQGATVSYENNIQGNLNKMNIKTISFGMGGNGPLLSYASLKEYISEVKAKKYLYIFTEENDLNFDLFIEKKHPILKNYFNRDFSQQLNKKREVIEKIKIDKNNLLLSQIEKSDDISFINTFKLKQIRNFFNVTNIGLQEETVIKKQKLGYQDMDSYLNSNKIESNLFLFEKIIENIKYITDGKILILFLPTKNNFINNNKSSTYFLVKNISKKNKIKFIDPYEEISLKKKKDLKKLYPRNYKHFNSKGYFFIANIIKNNLTKKLYKSSVQ